MVQPRCSQLYNAIAGVCRTYLGTAKVHALRHTFAAEMDDAGAPLRVIQARLGHSNAATTSRYLAALKSARNLYADELARRFGFNE